jgi:hypothetical protein
MAEWPEFFRFQRENSARAAVQRIPHPQGPAQQRKLSFSKPELSPILKPVS